MERSVYEVETEVEAGHWWFVGRRRLLSRVIGNLGVAPSAAVLDIGTGTGTNLRLMRDLGFTNVTGLDASDAAIRHCAEKGLGTVRKGDAGKLPFDDASFDLVLATDIIEHLDDDLGGLAESHRVLRPGGSAVFMVPAFQSLWGLQDDVSHHRRRYRLGPFLDAATRVGLRVETSFYFNYLLFVPIWLARQVIRIFRIDLQSENQVNSPSINWLLTRIFAFDVATAPWLGPPAGVSILCVTRRDASAGRSTGAGTARGLDEA